MAGVTELHVNGSKYAVETDPQRNLLSVLRDDLGLTGSKYGCGEGRCGACTVLHRRPGRSLVHYARSATARASRSRRSKGSSATASCTRLQQAFLDAGAMQCGYCTPGMIMGGCRPACKRTPRPRRRTSSPSMEGNICRCGTYARIVEAVQKAAHAMKGGAR